MTIPLVSQATQELKPMELRRLPERPLVSVLIANYNYAQYVGEAIRSILDQTYSDFEVIVCDDGSTDNSCQVIRECMATDSRIKLIEKRNGGVASALNAAYGGSRGSIICFLDADDLYCPGKLGMIVDAFLDRPTDGLLAHPVILVDKDRRSRGIYPLLQNLPNGWQDPEMLQRSYLALPPSSGLCIRREIADCIFPISDSFRTNVDGLFQVLGPLMTPMIGLRQPLAERRIHNANLTHTTRVTPEYLERELGNHRRLWEVQRRYLSEKAPGVTLVPDACRPTELLMGYVSARLRGGPESAQAHRRLTEDGNFQSIHPASRLFWRYSIWLPRPVFARIVDLMWSDGRLRLVVNALRAPWRNSARYQ